jgi:hypothetical protein
VCPTLPLAALPIHELEVGLVHECRRREVFIALNPQATMRNGPEIIVREGDEAGKRRIIARAPLR